MLYKQLIRPVMDYPCSAWRSAARTHVRRLQVLQSKCLLLDTCALWCFSSRQIHHDLCVPLFAGDIGDLSVSFDSKVADVGTHLFRHLGRYLRPPTVYPVARRESHDRRGPAGQSRLSLDDGQVDKTNRALR
jgi:hypothetical protein